MLMWSLRKWVPMKMQSGKPSCMPKPAVKLKKWMPLTKHSGEPSCPSPSVLGLHCVNLKLALAIWLPAVRGNPSPLQL